MVFRPVFWISRFMVVLVPGVNSLLPAIDAVRFGDPDMYFVPARAGEAISAANVRLITRMKMVFFIVLDIMLVFSLGLSKSGWGD